MKKTFIFGLILICFYAVFGLKLKPNSATELKSHELLELHDSIKPIIQDHIVDLSRTNLSFYWKDKEGARYGSLGALESSLKADSKKLVFAMNGGMYRKDFRPQGLYIERGLVKVKMDTVQKAFGNFYMQPNGVLILFKNKTAKIIESKKYLYNSDIDYATQSGPMLLINGKVHPKFRKGSKNVHIRNGVGVLPDGRLLFAISTERINFYDFASYFKVRGCKNALYLDGFVSKMFLPEKGRYDKGGNFGVIIGETEYLE